MRSIFGRRAGPGRLLLFPALCLALALVGVGAGPARAEPDQLGKWRSQALSAVNADRQKHGREPLELTGPLNEAAQRHAEDMAQRNYYSHTSPEGNDVQDRFIDAGGSRWKLVEENIARCAGCRPPINANRIEKLETGWMNSPHHRENILREGLEGFGYGIVLTADDGLYAVQTFSGPGTSNGGEEAQAAKPLDPAEVPERAAELMSAARKRHDAGPVETDDALIKAARSFLPAPGSDDASLKSIDLADALPAGERGRWRSLSVLSAACGGCGTKPTAADIRSFREQWLGNARYRKQLLDPDVTDIGFALQANGGGRKVAIMLMGTRR
ncbi:CAP domain-containing protein [Aurantimonas sp. VKM B-3413]|uniref:CAP domain-containing protein n=1 Tax=Aurantimonas sp. VKM B-3413 TaxID=2779401 RepID=UPI001E351952|nr:CAP domain-containing protein [Aurantimonas sp. VKM B-3413]MCB8838848.1 CAP domain-containing protein [Aurantimonas sp. VKM B-3413]